MSYYKVIRLPVGGIVVTLYENGGTITSELREKFDDGCLRRSLRSREESATMDGIEATILGHACAGIDIELPAYIEGIESAIQGTANNV